jgi:hypothetical protein
MKASASIFLSYARSDGDKVVPVYRRLVAEGLTPWMDVQDVLPGQHREDAVKRAIRGADFVLVCLSAGSVNRRGSLQKEIKAALEILEEKLEEDIYLIPVRLEECEIPEALSAFQYADLFTEEGWPRLIKAIQVGVARLTLKDGIDEAVKTAGQFIDPRKRTEFEQHFLGLSPSMETLVKALYDIDNFVEPAKRLSFEHLVTKMLSRFIEQQIKETRDISPVELAGRAPKWRELRYKIEATARRFDLLRPPSPKDFQATLMWIAERGSEGELELLLQIEKDPPFHSEEIKQLIQFAKSRIAIRHSKPTTDPGICF